jgi:hypothetical protein
MNDCPPSAIDEPMTGRNSALAERAWWARTVPRARSANWAATVSRPRAPSAWYHWVTSVVERISAIRANDADPKVKTPSACPRVRTSVHSRFVRARWR